MYTVCKQKYEMFFRDLRFGALYVPYFGKSMRCRMVSLAEISPDTANFPISRKLL